MCQLQRFYTDTFVAGKRPRLAIMAPPQHGKSLAATDFHGVGRWQYIRLENNLSQCHSTELWDHNQSTDLQRILTSDRTIRTIFGFVKDWLTRLAVQHGLYRVCQATQGSFQQHHRRWAPINGMELHLGVIDDPVKGQAEANSRLVRDRTWTWFADDFLSRFAEVQRDVDHHDSMARR